MAITGVHTLIHTDDAPATRAFLRDVVGFPYVTPTGWDTDGDEEDWLIFGTGPSELGVHPTRTEWHGKVYHSPRHHEIALMCDDLDATVFDLATRGATFSGDPKQVDFGRFVMLQVPGADDILLYQPEHPLAAGR